MKNVCTNCRLADIYKSKNLDKKELNISDRVLLAVAFEAHFFLLPFVFMRGSVVRGKK